MSNWVTTLQNARSALAELSELEIEPERSPETLASRLCGDLHRLSKQHGALKIFFNVQMAAIGLFFVLQGCKPKGVLVCLYFYFLILISHKYLTGPS